MLKRITLAALSIALLGAVALGGVWLTGQVSRPAQAQESPVSERSPTHTITVLGQGTARVQPDIARISAGVETAADTVAEAMEENQAKMKAILAALKAQGIADKDIQTANFSIYFERLPETPLGTSSTESAAQRFQYRVSNMASVTIRDLAKVGDVLDAVVEAGSNNIWGVSFSVDDPKAAQAEARAKALADAGSRAAELAELGKLTLGPIMSISEVVSGGSMPMAVAMEKAYGGGETISPGEVEIGYQVQVVYYLEP